MASISIIFIAVQCCQCSTMQAYLSLSLSRTRISTYASGVITVWIHTGEAEEEEQQQMDLRCMQSETISFKSLCSVIHG